MDNNNPHYGISYSSGDSSTSSLTTLSITTTTTTDPSSTMTTTSTTAISRDQFLRHLNKLSHKISKPTTTTTLSTTPFLRRPPPDLLPPPPLPPLQPPQQPPVYNISKSDFRDVVQRLTGSPAHDNHRPVQPPPPKPASSRLQRIRPPPLAQLANRPPPLAGGFMLPPGSPLPPLPACHAAAESPISAYMRFLHGSGQPNPVNPLGEMPPSPSSPLPAFGCLLSPKSPCPLLSPNLLFSPTAAAGLLGFPPVSPRIPGGVPSPK